MGRQGRRSTVGLREMSQLERRAYYIYKNQEKREGVEYSWEDFRKWYLCEFQKKKWKRAHVGRKDHDKPYSFSNIEMQEQADNNRERNARRGNPCKSHKKVIAICVFASKVEAAKFFKISEKTVYNHCQNKTNSSFKYGRKAPIQGTLRFKWNT